MFLCKKTLMMQEFEEKRGRGSTNTVTSFIRFCNFYQKFIPNFSALTWPLHDLTKKGVQFPMDQSAGWCLYKAQGDPLVSPSDLHARHFQTLPCHDRCFPHCLWGSPYAGWDQWRSSLLHLPLPDLLTGWIELWHLWSGTPHHPSCPKRMVTLPHGDCPPSHYYHWS